MTVPVGAFEKRGTKDEQKLMFIDVRKAHLNGVVDDQEWVIVELPPEFHAYGRFARISRWLFGMRKAAISWETNYAEKLAAVGFKRARTIPWTFCETPAAFGGRRGFARCPENSNLCVLHSFWKSKRPNHRHKSTKKT